MKNKDNFKKNLKYLRIEIKNSTTSLSLNNVLRSR